VRWRGVVLNSRNREAVIARITKIADESLRQYGFVRFTDPEDARTFWRLAREMSKWSELQNKRAA
jgi:hypothetical protein